MALPSWRSSERFPSDHDASLRSKHELWSLGLDDLNGTSGGRTMVALRAMHSNADDEA